ncbi:MAG: YhbY family RNA-binding protein [Calditrichaceae bacterium]
MTGKEKRALRARGNRLKAVITVGKEGLTGGTINHINAAFRTHDLLKVKLLDTCPQDKDEVTVYLSEIPETEVVQVLGRTFLIYRPLPEEEKSNKITVRKKRNIEKSSNSLKKIRVKSRRLSSTKSKKAK